MRAVAFVSLASLVLCGCASYSARELPTPDRGRYSSTVESQAVWASTEAYSDADRQKAYLGEDFGSVGAIPVLVLLENKSSRTWELRAHAIQMRMPNGNMERESGPEMAFIFVHADQNNAGGAGSLFGVVGALAVVSSVQSESDRRQARAKDYERKGLGRGELNPGESRQGFVYFVLPVDVQPFTEATLILPLSERSGETVVEMQVPIKSIQFPSFSKRKK